MSLEDTISAAEIALSKRIHRVKSLSSLCAGGVAALFGAVCTEAYDYEYMLSQPYFSLSLGVITSTLLTNLLHQPVNMFSRQGFPLALRGLTIGRKLFSRSSVQERVEQTRTANIRFLEDLIPLTRDPLAQRRLQISLALAQKQYEQAIRRAVPLLEAYEQTRPLAFIWNRIRGLYEDAVTHLARLHHSAEFSLSQSLTYLSRGNLREAERAFSSACSTDDPLKIPIHCLYSYFLDLQSRRRPDHVKKSRQQWEKTIDLILRDPVLQQRFHRIGESRNEVLEIGGEGILHDTFIFKKNKFPSYLAKEYALSKWLHTLFHGDSIVVQPLAYISQDASPVYVSRRVQGIPLDEALGHTSPSLLLERAIECLHRFQTTATAAQHTLPSGLIDERNYLRFLREKFVHRVTSDTAQQEHLAQHSSFLAGLLHHQPRMLIHGDYHPRNIYAHGDSLTLLDPEHMTLAAAEFDLVDLLENHYYSVDPALMHPLLQCAHHSLAPNLAYEEWLFSCYMPAAAYRHLHRMGAVLGSSDALQPDTLEQRKAVYCQKALHALVALRTGNPKLYDSCRALEDLVVAA